MGVRAGVQANMYKSIHTLSVGPSSQSCEMMNSGEQWTQFCR